MPNVAVIIGEGGSGGAIAIATANQVLMLEHAIYTVISPEGAASILWHDSSRAQDAATNMKITAQDLLRFGVIDGIIERAGRRRAPRPGRRRSTRPATRSPSALADLDGLPPDEVRRQRREKFLAIGRALTADGRQGAALLIATMVAARHRHERPCVAAGNQPCQGYRGYDCARGGRQNDGLHEAFGDASR